MGQKGHPCGLTGQDQRGLFSNLKTRDLPGWILDLSETKTFLSISPLGTEMFVSGLLKRRWLPCYLVTPGSWSQKNPPPPRDTPHMLGLGEILYLKLRMSQFCGELVCGDCIF